MEPRSPEAPEPKDYATEVRSRFFAARTHQVATVLAPALRQGVTDPGQLASLLAEAVNNGSTARLFEGTGGYRGSGTTAVLVGSPVTAEDLTVYPPDITPGQPEGQYVDDDGNTVPVYDDQMEWVVQFGGGLAGAPQEREGIRVISVPQVADQPPSDDQQAFLAELDTYLPSTGADQS